MCDNNLATREEVYEAIDSERAYQDNLARNTAKFQAPLEHLTIIRRITRDMEDSWYDNPGPEDMAFMRKIAAVAVRAMEQHGAPLREFEPDCSEVDHSEDFDRYD